MDGRGRCTSACSRSKAIIDGNLAAKLKEFRFTKGSHSILVPLSVCTGGVFLAAQPGL